MGRPAGQQGTAPPSGGNAENLLDIDFDGAAPASMQKAPGIGSNGLEGLAGTPMRVASPDAGAGNAAPAMGGMDDLMGMFGDSSSAPPTGMGMGTNGGGGGASDLLDGFASLGMGSSSSQPPPPGMQLDGKKGNEDMLDLI